MKRMFIFILAAVTALAGMTFTNTAAAVDDDIDVEYRLTESVINKNEYFTIYLSFGKNNNDVDKVSVAMIDNEFFKEANGDIEIAQVDFDKEYAFDVQYLGGSEKLPLKIDYEKDGSPETGTFNVAIDEIDDDSTTPSTGSGENEPNLVIESTTIPSAAAGDTLKIPMTITNESRHNAKNISVKLSLDGSDDNPFEMNSLNLMQSISSLNAKKSDMVVFNLKVKPYAAEQTYALNVEFKYYNSKNTSFTSNEKVYVKVTNNNIEPILVIGDIKYSSNPVKAGAKMQVSLDISNMGDLDAEGVRLSVEGLGKDGFTLSKGVDSWYFDRIEGNGRKNILLNLIASDTMDSGNYGLKINMEYKDRRNNNYTNSSSFFVNVQGKSSSSNVSLNNVSIMPQEVKANENFMLSFDICNEGASPAKEIKVTVKGEENIISKSPDVAIIDELAAGEQKKLEYVLYANNEAISRNYNIQISLEYEDGDKEGTKHSVNQYAGVYVNGSSSKITPKIIISNYNFEPKLVRAGEEFGIDLAFMNTSAAKAVSNIKIYLTGIDSDKEGNIVFTPVGSSNTFFIDSIKPKSTAGRSIKMFTIPDAQPKYYNITANIEYQDEEGTEYKAEELIGIPVIQQSKLDASEIGLPPEVYLGQPTPISLQYYNKGKTKLSNLMIKVEGDLMIENGESFIGNFESGSSDYFEAMFTATKPGITVGKVVFSFEDPSGEELTYEREFTINAVEMPPMDFPGEMPPPPLSTKDKIINNTVKNIYFWIGIAVIIAAVITARKLIKNKKRKVMDLDE